MNERKKWYDYPGEEQDVILNTQVYLSRNIEGFPFVRRLHTAEKRELIRLVQEAVESPQLSLSGVFQFCSLEEISKAQTISLVEKNLLSPEYIARREGRGIFVSEDEALSVILNGEDHIQFHASRPGLELEGAYDAVDRLERILSKVFAFSFEERFGYLTQNPIDLGTGMHASLTLHLPALAHNGAIPRVAASLSRLGIDLREGISSEGHADVYRLTNRVSLGISEQEALFNLKSMALQVVAQERTARQGLLESPEIQDKVYRAMGTLLYARLLTQEESMELLSCVRLGVSQGCFSAPEYTVLARIMEEIQPATLSILAGTGNPDLLDQARAEYIRKAISA